MHCNKHCFESGSKGVEGITLQMRLKERNKHKPEKALIICGIKITKSCALREWLDCSPYSLPKHKIFEKKNYRIK